MKKFLTVSLATLLAVSSLSSVSLAAPNVGPGEVTNVTPADFAENVDRNAVLEAVIKDPNGLALKNVDFMKGFKYDFGSDNGITGFQGSSAIDPLSAGVDAGTAFDDTNEQAAAYPDNKYAVTDGNNTFPFHRFEVDVANHLAAGNEIELHWQGNTLASGKLILSAWDYNAEKWVVLEEKAANTDGNVTFSKVLTDPKFFQTGKVQAMVHDAAPANAPTPGASDEKFTLAWFTDTQFYAQDQPEVWDSMTDYMIDEYNNGNIEYVINTGDLVNLSTELDQWAVVDENLTRMDEAGIPYGVLAGNRDIIIQETGIRDFTNYYTYAGAHRFEGKSWYGGNMDNNRNHFDLMSFGGHEFIIVYLSHGTADDDDTVQWANDVLKEHSEKNAILALHEYVDPGNYGSGVGEIIFDRIVVPSENVKMVLSGHFTGAVENRKYIEDSDGSTRTVVELLANYQGRKDAEGYMRLMTFDPETNILDFDTYSPYYDDYNYYYDNNEDFDTVYELEPTAPVEVPSVRQVSTDYVAVNVYTDETIGSVSNLASGTKASVEWNELEALTQYFWYMTITNAADEKKTSEIYRFTTNDAASPAPEEPVEPTFPDIAGTPYAWALEYIEAMAARGIIAGHEDGTFKPGNSIDRQHVALMFTRAMDLNKVVAPTPFVDVPQTMRYYDEIMEAQQAGIFVGYQNKFRPYGKMTRAEMAKVLVVAFDIDVAGDHPFTDVPEDHWAAKYIGPLYAAGITEGVSKTEFNLETDVTRAEFATFMYRALEYKENNQ
ncbi:S-layer homology domain-containing protein [Planococcus salinarum]|uniref:S-layer homology domain-containing protein n=1 Tax=Planococcus salinarum TaxID=622695 RepID=UPI00163D9AC6|nr:S-layer homology domain-containing protein [Planococcus salinarum]